MKNNLLLFLVLFVLSVSCQKIVVENDQKSTNLYEKNYETTTVNFSSLPSAIIGDKFPNPLNVDNLKNAFLKLDIRTRAGYSVDDIKATHHYIAFTPTNDAELAAVQALEESQVIIHYFPVDYDVTDGILVPDNRFMINGYHYYWAYVPIDMDLNSFDCPYIYYYDITAIDEDGSYDSKAISMLPSSLKKALFVKSCELCDVPITPIAITKADIHPSGHVRFYDSDSNYQSFRGIEGFKVRAIRGTHHCYMNCDANGYFYSSDTFKYSFQYEFMFRRDNFEIRRGEDTSVAVIKVSGQNSPINVNFADDETCFLATIDRAAITYYYGNNLGLLRPPVPSGNIYRPAIQAVMGNSTYMVEKGRFSLKYFGDIYKRPLIHVFREHDNTQLANADIYETTIHELAHSVHWAHDNSFISNYDDFVIESYAKGIAWAITNNEYPSHVPVYFKKSYSGIIQDLVDGVGSGGQVKSCEKVAEKVNGSWTISTNPSSYIDMVSGLDYSIVENTALNSHTLNEWVHNLLVYYPSEESHIKSAFFFWSDNTYNYE